MELTLKRLLEQAEFSQVKKGGYDRDEVNAFLDRAVAMATKVEAKLTETMGLARDASAPSAEDLEAEVERRVAARLADQPVSTPAASGPSDEEAAEEVARTLLLAQRTADAAVREARDDAERIRAEADTEAERSRAALAKEVEAERSEARGRIRSEIAALESAREALRTDVGVLERFVEEQRNQLRSSVGELQRLLEDPTGFRMAPQPILIDPEIIEDDPTPLVDAAEVDDAESSSAGVVEADSSEDALDAPPPSASDAAAPAELSFGGVDHAPPAPVVSEPTQPVPAIAAEPADGESSDDPFMAELRKAMTDEEPLGPRDDEPAGPPSGGGTATIKDPGEGRGWRFGRR